MKQNIDGKMKNSLETLSRLSGSYAQWKPADKTLQDAHAHAKSQWDAMKKKIESFRQQLQEIPAQWKKYQMKYVFQ